jgi:diguanylate cyclase (GGDEF)-like protein
MDRLQQWALGPLERAPSAIVMGALWIGGLGFVVILGLLLVASDAEFAFASAAILPVVLVAWTGGRRHGVAFALSAAFLWALSDHLADRSFSAPWIPVANSLTRAGIYVLLALLTGQVRKLMTREHRLARRDMLTGVLNRHAFAERGKDEIERARRYGHPIAFAFLDLDRFKALNDTCGHLAGDQALITVSSALLRSMRGADLVARFGGDEFAILMPETPRDACAEIGPKLAESLRDALVAFPTLSVSIGITWFAHPRAELQSMVDEADALMYQTKKEQGDEYSIRYFDAVAENGERPASPPRN